MRWQEVVVWAPDSQPWPGMPSQMRPKRTAEEQKEARRRTQQLANAKRRRRTQGGGSAAESSRLPAAVATSAAELVVRVGIDQMAVRQADGKQMAEEPDAWAEWVDAMVAKGDAARGCDRPCNDHFDRFDTILISIQQRCMVGRIRGQRHLRALIVSSVTSAITTDEHATHTRRGVVVVSWYLTHTHTHTRIHTHTASRPPSSPGVVGKPS